MQEWVTRHYRYNMLHQCTLPLLTARVDYCTEALEGKHDKWSLKQWLETRLPLPCFASPFSSGLLAQNTSFPLHAMKISSRKGGWRNRKNASHGSFWWKDRKYQEHIQEWTRGSIHFTEMALHSPTCSSVPTTPVKSNPQMDGLEHPLESRNRRTTCLLSFLCDKS